MTRPRNVKDRHRHADRGQLIQFARFGATILQGDVDGNGVADIEIALDNAPVLVAADFVF